MQISLVSSGLNPSLKLGQEGIPILCPQLGLIKTVIYGDGFLPCDAEESITFLAPFESEIT